MAASATRARDQYTCRCRAYRFPHRFGGGRCTGIHLAREHWNTFYGHDRTCKNCNSFDEDEHSCQVLDGGNAAKHCEVVIEFMYVNSIK